jgi:serine/threonine-protein kinase
MSAGSQEQFRRIDAIFDAALDREPNERERFVVEASAGDHALVAAVMRLLAAHDRSPSFLSASAVQVAPELLDEIHGTTPPDHVGPFRLMRELGHGGMGVVYLAEREDAQVQQRVALKLIREAGDSPIAVRRFLEERRILALLEHPGIARLIDAGVTSHGLPYFAMELVDGAPIDSYCDERRLTVDERIDLFSAVCDAVQYAHQQFVIHRDLKPSNILVRDGGQLKLLDFGIAKLLDPLRPDESPETRTGMLALTPEYAAPEQIRGDPATAATDTYALGVLLYLLLTGRRPYEVRGRPPAELQRIVCEIDPPRPSSTLGGASDAETIERARYRSSTPDKLRRRLRGDLDLIVMKALHKDPSHRYSSAAALRDDLERWRHEHPVRARPDAILYRVRKFVRRNPAAVVVLALLVAYAATVTVQREHVRRALDEATLGTQRAEQVTDFMLALFEESEAGHTLTDTLTARTLLDRGERHAEELSGQPAMQAQMLEVLGRLHAQLGKNDKAKSLLERSLSIRRKLYGEAHPDYVTTLGSLADAVDRTDDPKQVAALRQQAYEAQRRLTGDNDLKTASAMWALAEARHRIGDNKTAGTLFDTWLATLARLPKEQTPERAMQLSAAAEFLEYRGELPRAETLLEEALAIRRTALGDRHHLVAISIATLGYHHEISHRHDLAEPLLRQAVGMLRPVYPEGSPEVVYCLSTWVTVLEHMGRFADALPAAREVADLNRRFYGDSSIDVATSELNVATALNGIGAYGDGESTARAAIGKMRVRLGAKSGMIDAANVTLANSLRGAGKLADAESLLLAAFRRFDPPKPITRNWHDAAAGALVKLYEAENRPNEAAKYRATMQNRE